jgi:hypothetical protein
MKPPSPTPVPIEVERPGADSFDAPARVPGTEQIIVRARGADGAFLVRLERTEPLRALMTGEICGVDDACDLGPTSRFVVAPRTGTDRFDADEIASPSLVRDADGLLRLYYTGRRANRWTVTVVISENGDFWRRVSETAGASDEVLGPDDRLGPLGFSSVGTLLEGDALTLVVEGWSGTQGRFSIARQTL